MWRTRSEARSEPAWCSSDSEMARPADRVRTAEGNVALSEHVQQRQKPAVPVKVAPHVLV